VQIPMTRMLSKQTAPEMMQSSHSLTRSRDEDAPSKIIYMETINASSMSLSHAPVLADIRAKCDFASARPGQARHRYS
jgi:ubiquitin